MTALTPDRRANSDRIVDGIHRRALAALRRSLLIAEVTNNRERAAASRAAIAAVEELLTASPPIPAQRLRDHPGDDLVQALLRDALPNTAINGTAAWAESSPGVALDPDGVS